MTQRIGFTFNRHGLGDVVHAAIAVQLFIRRGFEVVVKTEPNKRFVWTVAGVTQTDEPLQDHPYAYPGGFEDLGQPDSRANKVAGFFKQAGLPSLGDDDVVWNELCGVRLSAKPFISDEARAEASRFIEGLPKPIFCLHASGTNWRERKSLPVDTSFSLIQMLLKSTGGSVISLDWDSRDPIVASDRCKPIYPTWGRIDTEKLCALYELTDLMIGIDSGPFHLAALTGVKCLGVFRSLHPVRCCLPNPKAAYFCTKNHELHWAQRRPLWNILTYPGAEPTAEDIAYAATRFLFEVRDESMPVDAEPIAQMKTLAGLYLYRRVGHDERRLRLEPDGMISEGGGGCEQRWFPRMAGENVVIDIWGKEGVICSCEKSGTAYSGAWKKFERMPIELIPLEPSPPAVIQEVATSTAEKPKICIYTYGFNQSCGGSIALYKLAEILREMGIDCRVWQDRCGINHSIPVADANWIDDTTAVIYPEIVVGNPLNAKHVVRWLLNGVGVLGGDKTTWGPDDIRVAYQPRFRSEPDEELLTAFEVWPEITYPGTEERSGTCFVIHKGHAKMRDVATDGAMLVSMVPAEAAEAFRRHERFISYDSATWLSIQAALCGCLSIVIPDPGVSAEQWRASTPFHQYGIAYGFSEDELRHARDTLPLVAGHIEELRLESRRQAARLVDRISDRILSGKHA